MLIASYIEIKSCAVTLLLTTLPVNSCHAYTQYLSTRISGETGIRCAIRAHKLAFSTTQNEWKSRYCRVIYLYFGNLYCILNRLNPTITGGFSALKLPFPAQYRSTGPPPPPPPPTQIPAILCFGSFSKKSSPFCG